MNGVVMVYAFEPIEELDDATGVLAVDDETAARLVESFQAERIEDHKNDALRYVAGSDANVAAGEALHAKRTEVVSVRGVRKPTKPVR